MHTRLSIGALLPVAICATSLVLAFLCVFAGSSRGFMEDYALLTLNTSRVGENLLNDTKHSSNPFWNEIDNITNSIKHELDGDINDVARALGLHDFYSAHILDYCEGFYKPGPVANTTVSRSEIHKNVTFCSNRTALYHFEPQNTLQHQLRDSKYPQINLEDLHWPDKISSGLNALRDAQRAVFILYCVAIGFVFIALVLSVTGLFLHGRLTALFNVIIDWLAFLTLGMASAVVTAIIVEATHLINHFGNDIGVSAQRGPKFLALTWAATALMLVASMGWCFECIVGRRRQQARMRDEKHG